MGYRLTISDTSDNMKFYGTKLLGYTEKELSSINYLRDINKWCNEWEDDYSSACDDYKTRINADEFRKFCELYADDLEKYSHFGNYKNRAFLQNEKIKELLESEEDKILSWG